MVGFIQKYGNDPVACENVKLNNYNTERSKRQKGTNHDDDDDDDDDEFESTSYWSIYKKFMNSPCVKCFYDVVSSLQFVQDSGCSRY